MSLSFTQLSSYRRCPRQYEYCYVKKIPKGISEAEAFGAAIHSTLKKWGEIEMRESDRQTVARDQFTLFTEQHHSDQSSLTTDHLMKLWHTSFPLNAYATRVEADMARLRGEAVLQEFFLWWREKPRTVVAVEKGFTLEMQNAECRMQNERKILNSEFYIPNAVTITGRFDRIERDSDGLHVIDFKTSAPRTQQDTDADLQLSIYALASKDIFTELPKRLSFLHLAEDGVTELSTERSNAQIADAMKLIGGIEGRITEKDFHPTPSVEKCRRCPYKGVCDVAAV